MSYEFPNGEYNIYNAMWYYYKGKSGGVQYYGYYYFYASAVSTLIHIPSAYMYAGNNQSYCPITPNVATLYHTFIYDGFYVYCRSYFKWGNPDSSFKVVQGNQSTNVPFLLYGYNFYEYSYDGYSGRERERYYFYAYVKSAAIEIDDSRGWKGGNLALPGYSNYYVYKYVYIAPKYYYNTYITTPAYYAYTKAYYAYTAPKYYYKAAIAYTVLHYYYTSV